MLKLGHPAITYGYVESIGDADGDVRASFESFFAPLLRREHRLSAHSRRPSSEIDIQDMARAAAAAMLAAGRARAVPGAVDGNRSAIEDRIAQCIRRNIPIPSEMLWSPKKHWVVGRDSNVDLAELTALNTLLAVHNAVQAIYPRGLAFTLHAEDLEFEFMEGADSALKEARNRYIGGLRQTIRALELDDLFTVVRMSEKAADREELRAWFSQMEENYRVLEAYWYESEERGVAGHEAYDSFRALQRIGWHGAIPEEMRTHYLRRLTSVRDEPVRDKVSMILRNFAGILLHHQKRLLDTGSEVDAIKFSFIPPAPGAPAQLCRGRIDLRFVARSICSLVGSAGPWSTKGYFRRRHGKIVPTFGSWHQQTDEGARLVEGHITLAGEDQAVDVRADFLVDNDPTWTGAG